MNSNDDNIRILLVEENRALAEARTVLLSEVGQVTWAADADSALQLVLTGDWNVAIVALELSGMDGLDLLRAMRALDPGPIALALGQEGSFEGALAAVRAGASDYVANSVLPELLLERVRHAIELDRASRIRGVPSERVLAIGAHPDDVELGCGGILMRHRDAGHALTILTLTGGEAGGAAPVRTLESQRAAALLSARLVLLDLGDTELPEGGRTIAAIAKVIEEVRPTTVYTHTSFDLHQDHRSAHRATMVAARRVPRVYAYQSPSTTVDFRPTRFVSIDDVLERKLELIAPHASQTQIRQYLDQDLLRATARYWGRFGGCDYAEPLEVLRHADLLGSPEASVAASRLDPSTVVYEHALA
jgi:LmbE family N-acetylglucosaminyl deacetylase/CheY-like chemotaxis protein